MKIEIAYWKETDQYQYFKYNPSYIHSIIIAKYRNEQLFEV